MLWLNGSNQIVKKDGLLVDCGECPCGDTGGYLFSINLDRGVDGRSGLYIAPKPGCQEDECQYDFSDFHCVDSIYGGDPYCDPPAAPLCPFHWHEAVYPYYDPEPPQWVIDEGKTWKIENDTLYIWERMVEVGRARTTIVFSLPEGCEFAGGRVCRHGWSFLTDVEYASLNIDGNHATLTYTLLDQYAGEAYFTLALLSPCAGLAIDSFDISGINKDCWEPDLEGLARQIEVHRRNLESVMDDWAENPDPYCQYVIEEEDEFE